MLKGSDDDVITGYLDFLNVNVASDVQSVVLKLPPTMVLEFKWKIRSMLETSKTSVPKMTKMWLNAVKSLKLSKDI
jgi:hypothetical protein